MLIRPETSSDQPAIFDVNARAFGREAEARLVDALRKSSAFIPELSFVACLPQPAPEGPSASEKAPAAMPSRATFALRATVAKGHPLAHRSSRVSWRAEVEGPSASDKTSADVVGHILFTRMAIKASDRSHSALALAPLAVMPSHQRIGIGSALVRHGLAESTRLGHHIVIVLGHPEYYPKFGFVPASRFGIRSPFDVRPEAFMALELQPGALLHVSGEAAYPPEFMAG